MIAARGKFTMPRKLYRAGQPLQIRSSSATEAEIVIYAGIGQDWWGDGSMISAKFFSDELKKLPASVTTLNVRINSPGGDVFDGIAIYNRLKQFKGKKVVHIDGLAASISSIIALAGDEIIIGEGALFMIHLPWTFAYGNRMEMDNTANRLMDIEEQMIGIYKSNSDLDRNKIRALLEAETWMSADDAIEAGFNFTKVAESVPIAASAIDSRWIMKKPKNFLSEEKAAQAKIIELKNKVAARLAR